MGLFSFTQEVAIDLGTANTIITCNDKMVVDEPSVIALDARSRLYQDGERKEALVRSILTYGDWYPFW